MQFQVTGAIGLEHLQVQLLIARQTRLHLVNLDRDLVESALVALQGIQISQTHVGQGELRIQTDRLLVFANGIRDEKTVLIVNT